MVLGGSSNIFDEASKKYSSERKKKEDARIKKPPAPEPLAEKKPIDDAELQRMFQRINALDDDLQKKMDRICEISGKTRKEIETYLNNQANFFPDEWKQIQLQKEQVEEMLFSKLGTDKQKQNAKKKKQLIKQRQGKTLGARKKWIDMR